MNFKEFIRTNPGSFLTGQEELGGFAGNQQEMPGTDVTLPTQTVEGRVFRINRNGTKIIIYVDKGTQWVLGSDRYYKMGDKAPKIGDYISVTFNYDNSVMNYNLVSRAV